MIGLSLSVMVGILKWRWAFCPVQSKPTFNREELKMISRECLKSCACEFCRLPTSRQVGGFEEHDGGPWREDRGCEGWPLF
jgi:hypothetical protein